MEDDIERRLAREAETLENRDDTVEDRDYARPAPARAGSQVYSVRIPVERLEQVRQLAAKRRTRPTAMIREWVLERLDTELDLRAEVEGDGVLWIVHFEGDANAPHESAETFARRAAAEMERLREEEGWST